MVTLYITSSEKGSGKTTIGAGLGQHLHHEGRKIGFFKPIIGDSQNLPSAQIDSDVALMKNLLLLGEPLDLLRPTFSDASNLGNKIKEAYAKISAGKDIVIIEGISEQSQACQDIAEALDAKVIIVESYSKEPSKVINSYKAYEKHLLGIVWNKVPRSRVIQMRDEITTSLRQVGVTLLGVLPEDRLLFTLTIGEIVELIHGEILSGAEKSDEIVENFMLGAMSLDPGPLYFGHKNNKAVILRSERPDMQLAALETSTKCLVLVGNTAPYLPVLYRAEEKNIPVILTQDDILTIATKIENSLGKTRFNQTKLPKLSETMEKHFDFLKVYRGLGLASEKEG